MMIPLDIDTLPEKDFSEYKDQINQKPTTEMVVEQTQDKVNNTLTLQDGTDVPLQALSAAEAEDMMKRSETLKQKEYFREDSITPAYKVWQQYDGVYLLLDGSIINTRHFLTDQMSKIRKMHEKNEKAPALGVRFFDKDHEDILDKETNGALKNKLTKNPYDIWQMEEKLNEFTYFGPRNGYPRAYYLENINTALDEIEFQEGGTKLLRMYVDFRSLKDLNEDLFEVIQKKSESKNVQIDFVFFDIGYKYKYNPYKNTSTKSKHNNMYIFSLEELFQFFQKNKDTLPDIKLDPNTDYFDEDRYHEFRDGDRGLSDEELEVISPPIPVITEIGKPYEFPEGSIDY